MQILVLRNLLRWNSNFDWRTVLHSKFCRLLIAKTRFSLKNTGKKHLRTSFKFCRIDLMKKYYGTWFLFCRYLWWSQFMEKTLSALRGGKACVVYRCCCCNLMIQFWLKFWYNAESLKPNTDSFFFFCPSPDTYTRWCFGWNCHHC